MRSQRRWLLCALSALALLACSSTAEHALQSYTTAPEADTSDSDVTCISVAAELSPCLSAVTPNSRLTTMEEADCCTTLLVFKEANCYCLDPENVQQLPQANRCALQGRLTALAAASRRCGWAAVTCPTPWESGTLKVGKREERAAPVDKDLEADLSRFYGGVRGDTRPGGRVAEGMSQPALALIGGHEALAVAAGTQGKVSLSQTDVERQEALLGHMTQYLSQIVELTEALAVDSGDEVELNIEVTMGSSKMGITGADKDERKEAVEKPYAFWVWVVGFVLVMLVVASLLCTSKECGAVPNRHSSRQPATAGPNVGIVVAAEEVQTAMKLKMFS